MKNLVSKFIFKLKTDQILVWLITGLLTAGWQLWGALAPLLNTGNPLTVASVLLVAKFQIIGFAIVFGLLTAYVLYLNRFSLKKAFGAVGTSFTSMKQKLKQKYNKFDDDDFGNIA
ncbi:hypothetical protein CON45_23875 [Priestia megaterium]|uniref:hypothetical protein n=1 Tax=Priestia megaterium TaxID=1404 RepID=UPI000BED1536|nr:hypothetical protein [Priestia megaterium]PEA36568.1 hypothetical protein CON45_23875 [Priestia megaterium]